MRLRSSVLCGSPRIPGTTPLDARNRRDLEAVLAPRADDGGRHADAASRGESGRPCEQDRAAFGQAERGEAAGHLFATGLASNVASRKVLARNGFVAHRDQPSRDGPEVVLRLA